MPRDIVLARDRGAPGGWLNKRTMDKIKTMIIKKICAKWTRNLNRVLKSADMVIGWRET